MPTAMGVHFSTRDERVSLARSNYRWETCSEISSSDTSDIDAPSCVSCDAPISPARGHRSWLPSVPLSSVAPGSFSERCRNGRILPPIPHPRHFPHPPDTIPLTPPSACSGNCPPQSPLLPPPPRTLKTRDRNATLTPSRLAPPPLVSFVWGVWIYRVLVSFAAGEMRGRRDPCRGEGADGRSRSSLPVRDARH